MDSVPFHDGNIHKILETRYLDTRLDVNHSLQTHSSLIRRLSQERELEGHLGCVNAVAWNSKGSLLISGSDDTRINIWSYSGRKLLHSIDTGHTANIFCTKFVPETSDELVVSGAGDAEVRLFNTTRLSGRGFSEDAIAPSALYQCHTRRVKKLAVENGNPNVVWSASEDGTLRQHDFREGTSCPPAGSSHQECRSVLLDLRSGAKRSLADPPKQVLALKSCDISSTRPHLLLVGGSDAFARLYDRRMLPPLSSCRKRMSPPPCVNYFCPMHLSERGHPSLHLTHVTFSPDGQEVLLSYSGEHVYLMNVNHGGVNEVQYTSGDVSKLMTYSPTINGVELHPFASNVSPNGFLIKKNIAAKLDKCRKLIKFAKKSLDEGISYYGIEACNEVLNDYSHIIEPALKHECLCTRATLLLKRKWKNDAHMALRDCYAARKIDNSSYKALYYMSEALSQLGRHKEALDNLHSISLSSFTFSVHHSLCVRYKMMGTWKKRSSDFNGTLPSPSNSAANSVFGRNLVKNELGGVIFGCKNTTIKECLSKQLFGLPAQHFCYVKNIEPGLPLFLFNYSDKKLHGIFEAASSGKMLIDHYGWTDGVKITNFPAQVQTRVQRLCQPVSEDKFKHIIAENYYNHHHFWFELDHAQTSKLISLLKSSTISPGNSVPQNTKWITISPSLPSDEPSTKGEAFKMLQPEIEQHSSHSCTRSDSTESDISLNGYVQPLDTDIVEKEAKQDDKNLILMKLKELALDHENQDPSSANVNDTHIHIMEKYLETPTGLEKEEGSPSSPLDYQYNIAQLVQEVKELTDFQKTQTVRNYYLEQKLMEAELEIQYLKDRCTLLESACRKTHVEKTVVNSSAELHLDPKDSLFLIGGFDGKSWLTTMDMYCTSQNVIKSLKPMSSVRSYASVVQLNGEIYVLGGGNGFVWYDTVESYNPVHDNWTLCPSLNQKKGSLSGAALNNKIFAVGGGNGVDCYSDVEMLDLHIGRWVRTRSMLDKRFALAAFELNGVLYATGGYDGNDYLKSAERFDPREHSWTKIPSMNTKRGCHSLVVLNDQLYALGGFDGCTMVPTVEVFDPRLGTWMMGETMKHPRGYSAAAVIKESIYVIGGVKAEEDIVDTVEYYKEGQGWQEISTTVVKRCFLSAIACSN